MGSTFSGCNSGCLLIIFDAFNQEAGPPSCTKTVKPLPIVAEEVKKNAKFWAVRRRGGPAEGGSGEGRSSGGTSWGRQAEKMTKQEEEEEKKNKEKKERKKRKEKKKNRTKAKREQENKGYQRKTKK